MNIDEIVDEFKTEIVKSEYFQKLCKKNCMTDEMMLRQLTDGKFMISEVRLAFDAWVMARKIAMRIIQDRICVYSACPEDLEGKPALDANEIYDYIDTLHFNQNV